MKKYIPLCLCAVALVGCEYTEQERQQFYQSCMAENHSRASGFLEKIAADCACEKWSLRKDIKPKDTSIRFNQYWEEVEKCYSEPIKLSYSQRSQLVTTCKQMFTETYYSMAEQLAMGGVPTAGIAEAFMFVPEAYKRSSNKDLVDCACRRLSLRDNFVLPRTLESFEKEYKKETKECKKIWNSK